MKLQIDHKRVTTVPEELIMALESSFKEEDWLVSDYRRVVDNMSKTNTIPILHTPLCAKGIVSYQAINDIREEKLYNKYFPLVEPIINLLKNHYTFNKYACFLTRLEPNSEIGMHVDKGLFLELCNRVHVPIVTNSKVRYLIDSQSYYWERGGVYEFDNTRMHGVQNKSNEYRIHFIINLYNLSEEELKGL